MIMFSTPPPMLALTRPDLPTYCEPTLASSSCSTCTGQNIVYAYVHVHVHVHFKNAFIFMRYMTMHIYCTLCTTYAIEAREEMGYSFPYMYKNEPPRISSMYLLCTHISGANYFRAFSPYKHTAIHYNALVVSSAMFPLRKMRFFDAFLCIRYRL